MQRKNYILRASTHKHRAGFAMIMALIVIVVIATIMALSLSLTTQTSKKTTDLYLYEQSVLYSKSAAELALLAIAQAPPCTVTNPVYNFDNNLYIANVNISYVYTAPSPCAAAAGTDYFTVTTPEQNGSVLMDITVTTNVGTEPIRYFRRSIQKL
jgi:Tfp pilus assembly protein PilV